MKIYEYILRMKDQASDKLNRLASSFNQTSSKADRLQGSTDRVSSRIAAAGNNAGRASSSFSELGNQWSRSLSLGTMLTRVLGPLALGAALTFGTMKASSLAREMEQASISFEVFLGSAKKADVMIGNITQMANVTPFTRTELMDSAKMMLNFGIAQDKIMPHLKMLGDISGGNAPKMHLMTLAFSQMSAAGRLMGQDLLQMINAGFNPLQEISTKTGISMAKLKKIMEDGAITTKMVEAAFQSATSEGGRYFGMMDKQSQTFEGRLSTLRDKMEIWGGGVGGVVNTFLSPILDVAISKLDELIDKYAKLTDEANKQRDVFRNLQVTVRPLLDQYMELRNSSKLNDDETRKMDQLMQQIGKSIPLAVDKFDAYGKVLKINAVEAESYISQQEALFKLQNTQAQAGLQEKLDNLEKERKLARGMAQQLSTGEFDPQNANVQQAAALKKLRDLDEQETKIQNQISKLRIDRNLAYLKGDEAPKSTGDPYADLRKKADNLKDGVHGIVGGGKQAVNVTINLQSLVAEQNFNTTTVKESIADMERLVTEALLRVVNSANYAAAQ